MKRIIQFLIPALIAVPLIFTGCKKGEDDPFISLHTRKARVTGEWKMSSGTSTDKFYDSASQTTYNTSITYDGSSANESQTVTNGSGSTTNTSSYSFTQTITFEKDGTFKNTTVDDGITTTAEGTWNFGAGVGDKKKKSELVLTYTKTVNDGMTYTYTGNELTEVYYLKELRNDKMVMVLDLKYTDSDGDTGEGKQEMTFEQ
ncbi:MAG: hypothetical protein ACOZCO_13625 [Bacteroidota bacterium]